MTASRTPALVHIVVNGTPLQVPPGTSVAAALAQQTPGTTRTSITVSYTHLTLPTICSV